MGFISNLFNSVVGLGSGFEAAYNAHFAEAAISELSHEDKRKIAIEMADMGRNASGGRVGREQFFESFNMLDRPQQLNLIAFACGSMGINASPDGKWMNVDNPFTVKISLNDILTTEIFLKKKYNLEIKLKKERIDIYQWLKTIDDDLYGIISFLQIKIEARLRELKEGKDERYVFTLLHFSTCFLIYIIFIRFNENSAMKAKDLSLDLYIHINTKLKTRDIFLWQCIAMQDEIDYIGNYIGASFGGDASDCLINYGELLCICHSLRSDILWENLHEVLDYKDEKIDGNLLTILSEFIYGGQCNNLINIKHGVAVAVDEIFSLLRKTGWL